MKFVARIRKLRRDDSAQVFLASGMMVFLCALFVVVTLNSSDSIYRRIQVQNAVDAATDTALAWQARGLNLMQHLNNAHYLVNSVAYPLEIIACCSCTIESVVYYTGQVLAAIPYTAAIGEAMVQIADQILEPLCIDICPVIDEAQYTIAEIIYYAQQVIACEWPISSLIAANSIAKTNGADPLIAALADYVDQAVFDVFLSLLSDAGVDIGLLDPDNVVIENGDRSIFEAFVQNVLAEIPLYAMPVMELHWYEAIFDEATHLDSDTGTFLGIRRIDDSESYPWYLSEDTISTCTDIPTHTGDTPDDPDGDNEWGWQDKYWLGHPKVMTWVVGSTNVPGGLLGWGVPPEGETRPTVTYDEATGGIIGHSDTPGHPGWYLAPSGFSALDRLAYAAFASGQVEGELVEHTEDYSASAEGHLIPVHFIGESAEIVGIYH